jgi:phage anti-repressor protein
MDEKDLRDFLLTHSKINKKFILDFFDIRTNYHANIHKPFIINLEIVGLWLNTTKNKLKETLVNSYKKNKDYKLAFPSRKASFNHGGDNKIDIFITPDTFKMLCMRSNTKKAEEVRKYYIQLEDLVNEYKEFIIKSQAEKIEKLEYELVGDKYTEAGYFYIYKINDYYKIGATNNLKLRFKNINSSHPFSIKPILTAKSKTPFQIEKCVQSIFAQKRIKKNKDFYKVELVELLDAIKDCEKIIDKYKCYKCNTNIQNIKNIITHKCF